MYLQIIDKETFNAVQEKLAKNRYTLGGQETARIPYLLTGKLFCGHCGAGMVADSGKTDTAICIIITLAKSVGNTSAINPVSIKTILNYTLQLA